MRQMGSIRNIDWVLNDMLFPSVEIILISIQVWIFLSEMCLAALWDERKLIQVELNIFRVATFLPRSIHLWQQKLSPLIVTCRRTVKCCEPCWCTSVTENYRALWNIVLCSLQQRLVLWMNRVCLLLHITFPCWSCRDCCFCLQYAVGQDWINWQVLWSG